MIAQLYEPAYPIDDLVEHPDNPRRGDEAAIEASMQAHGFYGAVLAQTSSRRIIAGNHRTRVARRLGQATIPVLFIDVDDDQARRLLLVDNRTNDFAGYDEAELAALLSSLADASDLIGTGYSSDDLADLLERLNPPTLEDLGRLYGAMTDDDRLATVTLKLDPIVANRFRAMLANAKGRNDSERVTDLLDRLAASV